MARSVKGASTSMLGMSSRVGADRGNDGPAAVPRVSTFGAGVARWLARCAGAAGGGVLAGPVQLSATMARASGVSPIGRRWRGIRARHEGPETTGGEDFTA